MSIESTYKNEETHWLKTVILWFDSYHSKYEKTDQRLLRNIDWTRAIPFVAIHLACTLVYFVGWSPIALIISIILFVVRMFSITAFYHRYFSHKTFKTHRVTQFIFAALGATAVQRGALWWAAHHRVHHATADKDMDQHSPTQHGFIWSHMGWFLSRGNFSTQLSHIKDFAKYPELKFLDRFDVLMPALLAVALYCLGAFLEVYAPSLHTNGPQLLIWGFVLSTVVLYHCTFTINSLAHLVGKKVFPSKDDSRNNFWLAIITLGEGWHNNHHFYPGSARQGFLWWEIDLTYYGLKCMEKLGIIWDIRNVPLRIMKQRASV